MKPITTADVEEALRDELREGAHYPVVPKDEDESFVHGTFREELGLDSLDQASLIMELEARIRALRKELANVGCLVDFDDWKTETIMEFINEVTDQVNALLKKLEEDANAKLLESPVPPVQFRSRKQRPERRPPHDPDAGKK